MRPFLLTFWLLLALAGGPALAQPKTSASHAQPSYTIPFQLTAFNNVVIKAILNDRDTLQLMLHTAATGVTLTDSARTRLQTLTFNGSVDNVKSWGGSANASAFSRANALAIGELRWRNVTVWTDQYSGQFTDGKVGLDLFAGKVIELDFTKQVLVIHPTLPANRVGYEQLALRTEKGALFLKATCQTRRNVFTHEFLLHSGYAGAVLLDDQVVMDHKLDQQIAITGEKILTDAYGHRITTKKGLLRSLQLGRYLLKQVPVRFFSGRIGQQRLSVLGGEVLKRFNWLLDIGHGWVYIKANGLNQRTWGS